MSSLLMGEKKPKLEKVQRRRCLLQELKEEEAFKNKPFSGKSFYLDLPSNKKAKFLADAVQHLGGTIESFLSKEVSYVVSNSKELRPNCKTLKPTTGKVGEAAYETGIVSSVFPEKENATGSKQKLVHNVQITRGKELLEKVMKNNDRSNNNVLTNARAWGVRILYFDDVFAYVEKMMQMTSVKEKTECSKKIEEKPRTSVPGSRLLKVGKLKHPFIKIEDMSRNFRPVYSHFNNFPDLYYLLPGSIGPFEPPEPIPCSQKEQRETPQQRETASEREEEKSIKPALNGQKKKRQGFCECCRLSFSELQMHLQTDEHRQYASESSHYNPVDSIMAQFTTQFTDLQNECHFSRSVCHTVSHDVHMECNAEVDVPNQLNQEEKNCLLQDHLEPCLKAANPRKCTLIEGYMAQPDCIRSESPPVLQRMDIVLDCSEQLASAFGDGATVYAEPPVLIREDFYQDSFVKDDYVGTEGISLVNLCDSGKEMLTQNMYSTLKEVFQSDITDGFLPDEDPKQGLETKNVEAEDFNKALCINGKRKRSSTESQLCIKRSRLASCNKDLHVAGSDDASQFGQLESYNSYSKAGVDVFNSVVLLSNCSKSKALCSFEEKQCTPESKQALFSFHISTEVPEVCKQSQEKFADKCELNKTLHCAQKGFTEAEMHFCSAGNPDGGILSAPIKACSILPVDSNLEQWNLLAELPSQDCDPKPETFVPAVSDKWVVPVGETVSEKWEPGELLVHSSVPSVVNDKYALHTFTVPHNEEFKYVKQQGDCTSLDNSVGNKLSDIAEVSEELPQRWLSCMPHTVIDSSIPHTGAKYENAPSSIPSNRKNVPNSSYVCNSSFLQSSFKIDASLFKAGNFSSDSEWDIPLLSQMDADIQTQREQSVDMEALARSCTAVRESGYESRLFSVLKQKSRLDQLGKDEISHGNCRSEIMPFMMEQYVDWAN